MPSVRRLYEMPRKSPRTTFKRCLYRDLPERARRQWHDKVVSDVRAFESGKSEADLLSWIRANPMEDPRKCWERAVGAGYQSEITTVYLTDGTNAIIVHPYEEDSGSMRFDGRKWTLLSDDEEADIVASIDESVGLYEMPRPTKAPSGHRFIVRDDTKGSAASTLTREAGATPEDAARSRWPNMDLRTETTHSGITYVFGPPEEELDGYRQTAGFVYDSYDHDQRDSLASNLSLYAYEFFDISSDDTPELAEFLSDVEAGKADPAVGSMAAWAKSFH